ncbi:MAG: hypothetical protein N2557_04870 [Hydrogenophilus sp.]|nr:hypothetical protein [Hydrogenophilus sp.]
MATVGVGCGVGGVVVGGVVVGPQRVGRVRGVSTLRVLCRSFDPSAWKRAVLGLVGEGEGEWVMGLLRERPHLVAPVALLVPAEELATMRVVVERVSALAREQEWQRAVLRGAPPLASALAAEGRRAMGLVWGFDFHLTERGPQLIEINTNAGGALINALLRQAQGGCCPELERGLATAAQEEPAEEGLAALFREEWGSVRREPLEGRFLAIVDDRPQTQYLFPEFVLFAALLRRSGWRAEVVDARELAWEEGGLWRVGKGGAERVDFVYNRLTDFGLEAPEHAALAEAVRTDGAVVSPGPLAHALLADKRRLALLSDGEFLRGLRVPGAVRALLLSHVPMTVVVTEENAEVLWRERRGFFFKPAGGYGSKAVYRGDKVTRRVWSEVILRGNYVAQVYTAPSVQLVPQGGTPRPLKFDVRAYAYEGRVVLFAARLYEGQTTNFRTAGGGFAPVFAV